MFNRICKVIYENQGEVYQAIAGITGDFEWPTDFHLYYETSKSQRVMTPEGEIVISLYRFATGRYELVCYLTGVK